MSGSIFANTDSAKSILPQPANLCEIHVAQERPKTLHLIKELRSKLHWSIEGGLSPRPSEKEIQEHLIARTAARGLFQSKPEMESELKHFVTQGLLYRDVSRHSPFLEEVVFGLKSYLLGFPDAALRDLSHLWPHMQADMTGVNIWIFETLLNEFAFYSYSEPTVLNLVKSLYTNEKVYGEKDSRNTFVDDQLLAAQLHLLKNWTEQNHKREDASHCEDENSAERSVEKLTFHGLRLNRCLSYLDEILEEPQFNASLSGVFKMKAQFTPVLAGRALKCADKVLRSLSEFLSKQECRSRSVSIMASLRKYKNRYRAVLKEYEAWEASMVFEKNQAKAKHPIVGGGL